MQIDSTDSGASFPCTPREPIEAIWPADIANDCVMSAVGDLSAWADSDSDGSIQLQTPLAATSATKPATVSGFAKLHMPTTTQVGKSQKNDLAAWADSDEELDFATADGTAASSGPAATNGIPSNKRSPPSDSPASPALSAASSTTPKYHGDSDSSEDWDEQLRHEQLDAQAAAGGAMPSAWGGAAGGASGVQAIRGMFKQGARSSYVAAAGSAHSSSAAARLSSVLGGEEAVTPAAITAALFEDSDSVATMSVSSDGGSSSPMRLPHAGSVVSMDSAATGGPRLSPLETCRLRAAQYALHAKPGGAHVRLKAPFPGMPAPAGNVLPACLEAALSHDAQVTAAACEGDPLVPPSFLQSSEDGDCSSAWGLSVPLDVPQGVGAALGPLGRGFDSSHELAARLGDNGVYRDMHRSMLCAPMLGDAEPIPPGFWVPPRPVASVSRGRCDDRRLGARSATTPRTSICALVNAVCDAALQTPPGMGCVGGNAVGPPKQLHRMTLSGEIALPEDGQEGSSPPAPSLPHVGLHTRGASLLPHDGPITAPHTWRAPTFQGQASSGEAYGAAQAPGKGRRLTALAQQLVQGVCAAAPLPAGVRTSVHSTVEEPLGSVGEGGVTQADALQTEVSAAVRAGMALLAKRLGAAASTPPSGSTVGRMWTTQEGGGIAPLSPIWVSVHVVLTRDALAHATSAAAAEGPAARSQQLCSLGMAIAVAGSLLGHTNDLLDPGRGHELAEQLWLPAIFEGCMDVITQLLRVAHFPPEFPSWLAGRQALAQAHAHFAGQHPEACLPTHHSSESTSSVHLPVGGGAAGGMQHAPTTGVLPPPAPLATAAPQPSLAAALAQRAGLRRRSMSGRHVSAVAAAFGAQLPSKAPLDSRSKHPDFLKWLAGYAPQLHVLATQGPRLDATSCMHAVLVCTLHRLLSSALHDLLLLSGVTWGFPAAEVEEAVSDRLQRHVRLATWQAVARHHVADTLHAALPQVRAAPPASLGAFPDARGLGGSLVHLACTAWLVHSWLQCEHRSPLHLTPERQHALALLSGCFAAAVGLSKGGVSPLALLGVHSPAPMRGGVPADTCAFDIALHKALSSAMSGTAAHDLPISARGLCSLLPGGGAVEGEGGLADSCTKLGAACLRASAVMHPRSALHDTVSSMLSLPDESDVWLAATLLSPSQALSAPVLANILATNAVPGIALNGRGASSLPVPQRGLNAGMVAPLMPSLLSRHSGVAAAAPPHLGDMQPTCYTGEIDYSAALADVALSAVEGGALPQTPPQTPSKHGGGGGHTRSPSMLGIHVRLVVDPAAWMTTLTAAALHATALQLAALQQWMAQSPWIEGTAQQLVIAVQGGRGGPQWRQGFDWSSIDQLQAKHDASRGSSSADAGTATANLDSHARLRLLRRCAALLRLLHFSGQQLQPALRGGGEQRQQQCSRGGFVCIPYCGQGC